MVKLDALIFLVLLVVVICFFRRLSNTVFFVAIFDIFLRILNKLDLLLGVPEYSNLVNKYFHSSMQNIIDSYSSGIINTILSWILLGIYVVFLFYVIRTFFRKKK